MADWTSQQVWRYVREQSVPYNPLQIRTMPASDAHCTRSVLPEKISGQGDGQASTRPSAACTGPSQGNDLISEIAPVSFEVGLARSGGCRGPNQNLEPDHQSR